MELEASHTTAVNTIKVKKERFAKYELAIKLAAFKPF